MMLWFLELYALFLYLAVHQQQLYTIFYNLMYWSISLVVSATGAPSLMSQENLPCPTEGLSIAGGYFNISVSHGFIVKYSCPEGFYPNFRTRKCRDGSWDPKLKKSAECKSKTQIIRNIVLHHMNQCRVLPILHFIYKRLASVLEITCPNPRVFENGEVTPYKEKYNVNDTTNYTCHSDYVFRGSPYRVCKPNGKWSGDTPVCGRNCE